MASAPFARYPSVANEHKFPQHPIGYSFSETVGTRIDPTFVRMQQGPNNDMHTANGVRINAFVYRRQAMTMCRDLRSMAISCIVHGILMIACYGVMFGLTTRNDLFNLTLGYGFWGGAAAVIGGCLALVCWSKSASISPLSSIPGFMVIAVSQLLALAVTLAAAMFATRAFRLFVLLPVLHLDNSWTFSVSSRDIFSSWWFYLNIVSTSIAWGPVGCLIWTFRHSFTVAIDVFSL